MSPGPAGERRAAAEAYLICATPRTGSTLLCGLLRSTGVAGRPESYFRQPDEPAWAQRWRIPRDPSGGFDYRDYLRAAVAAGTTPNGVFGARVMWGTVGELVGKLGTAYPDLAGAELALLTRAFGRVRFIHLRREDPVAQAVSWALAEQTHRWQPGDHPSPGRQPRFDFGQIHRLVRTIEAHTTAWRDWFASVDVRPYQVRYADLAADPVGVTTGVLDHLGLQLPAGRAITPRHRRPATGRNQEWIDRYRRSAAVVPDC